MPKVSVVIPVYKAEKTLRRCVESVIFGQEKDLEIILVEDCSPDGSWQLCQQLAEEYPQVRCLRNDQNRGVSYTRNRCLEAATGRYMLFVDSDDWVSGNYVKTLVDTQEQNPEKLIVCGYFSVNPKDQSKLRYGPDSTSVLTRPEITKLTQWVLIQQLWNKVFSPQKLREAGLRFNESICIGEDYQFVMDVLELMNYQCCMIIGEPLYYYVRYESGSLMSNWAQRENYQDALDRQVRLERIIGNTNPEPQLEAHKRSYAYRILHESNLPHKQRKEIVCNILGKDANAFCRAQRWVKCKQKALRAKAVLLQWGKIPGKKLRSCRNQRIIERAKGQLMQSDVTLISQSSIGDVLIHDMGTRLCSGMNHVSLSPTDFMKFASNLDRYLYVELEVQWAEACPVGLLDDLRVEFSGCATAAQVRDAWNRSKEQIGLNRVLLLCTDEGFDRTRFEQWKQLPYPKVLFTVREEYVAHPGSVYFPKYKAKGSVPDLISKREFYQDDVLIKKVNSLGTSE